ncbi:MAG: alpha/beta-type small acid-soluble spore protein [Firmicutes bacterium]|nr:alpha/beta-type small acid-soluble spore protein [Bacillota bacterium]
MTNKIVVPEAKQAMEDLKFEVANSLNVNLKKGYNGDLTAKENGSVGGEMVKRMIQQYQSSHK